MCGPRKPRAASRQPGPGNREPVLSDPDPGPRIPDPVGNGGRVARQERYVVGLDIGTAKVCTVVGELLDDGGVDVIGIGVAESKGLKRGVVVYLEEAVDTLKTSMTVSDVRAS